MYLNYKFRALLFFLPTVIRMLLVVITLPIMTAVLDSEDYGVFALIVAVANVFAVLPTLGSSVILAKYFALSHERHRLKIISNLTFYSLCLGIISGIFCIISWLLMLKNYENYSSIISTEVLFIACLPVVFNGFLCLSCEVATLNNDSKTFALINIIRDVVSSLSSVIALYVFNMGVVSLFVGYSISGAMSALLAFFVFRKYLKFKPNFIWLKRILNEYQILIAQLFEQGIALLEKNIIAHSLGLKQLGIYSHSKLYESIAMSISTAISKTGWQRALLDVKEGNDPIKSWYTTQAITLVGVGGNIFFSTIGYDVIGLLSNQKFNEAAFFAAVWSTFVACRSCAITSKAVLFKHGKSAQISLSMITSQSTFIVLLFLTIDNYGTDAIIVSFFASIIIQKTLEYYLSYKIQNIRFNDYYVILSLFTSFAFIFMSSEYAADFQDRLVFFCIFSAVSFVVFFKPIKRLFYLLIKNQL